MKKFIIVFLALLVLYSNSYAEIQWYKTTSMAIKFKEYNSYNRTYYWGEWSDWEKCVVDVMFDTSNDIIVIYSKETQVYKILYTDTEPYDSKGKQISFRVVDQDKDYGHLRLRVDSSGNSQIYVDFNDVMWVYNVYRVK